MADVLAARGWSALTCAPPTDPTIGQNALEIFVAALSVDGDVVLVAHSNAGAYVPALTMQLSVVGVVFVDAVLPPPRSRVLLAPLAFLDFLRQKADADGLLPVWTGWWPEPEVAALFPDRETRVLIEAEQPRIPVSSFECSLPAPEGWDDRPAAHLAFGDTYEEERSEARRCGWPVTTLSGEHLHLLVDPEQVAANLFDLLGRLGHNGRSRVPCQLP